jgi:hypothetical protein
MVNVALHRVDFDKQSFGDLSLKFMIGSKSDLVKPANNVDLFPKIGTRGFQLIQGFNDL